MKLSHEHYLLNDKFADFSLVSSEGVTFPAHRVLLASTSPFFRYLNSREECDTCHLDLSTELTVFLMNYIYTGQTPDINVSNAESICKLSDFYLLDHLKKEAEQVFIRQLAPSNAFQLFKFASVYNCSYLLGQVESFIHSNIETILSQQKEKFHQFLSIDEIESILKSSSLNVNCETLILRVIDEWLLFNHENHATRLYQTLRFFSYPCVICLDNSQISCLLNMNTADDFFQAPKNRIEMIKYFLFKHPRFKQLSLCDLSQEPRSTSLVFLLIGGLEQKYVRKFTMSGHWETTSLSIPIRMGHEVIQTGDDIYVIGGKGRNRFALKQMFCYNIKTNITVLKKSMEKARKNHAAVISNGMIYVIGGLNEFADAIDSVECYDIGKNKWTKLDSILEKRSGACAVVFNEKIFLFGGKGNCGMYNANVESFDLVTKQWTVLTVMPIPRDLLGVVLVNDEVYVVGGISKNYFETPLQKLNLNTNEWYTYNLKVNISQFALAYMDNRIFLFGGVNCDYELNDVITILNIKTESTMNIKVARPELFMEGKVCLINI